MPPESSLSVKKPISVWNKPLKANFKDFFKALGKAGVDGATGQWIGLGKDAVDAFAAIGLESNEPAELAWALIYNSLTKAIANLMAEGEFLIQYVDRNIDKLADTLDFSLENSELEINDQFFDHPEQLSLLKDIQTPLKQWFEGFKLTPFQAETLSARLPSYFVYALNQEWRQRPQDYGRIADQVNTAFTRVAEREQDWRLYDAWLQRQIEEPMMFEPFGLKDIYVPLRAYFRRKKEGASIDEDFTLKEAHRHSDKFERVVVDLKTELEQWLRTANNKDAIRVISGGPNSGKSSFAKIFAAHHAQNSNFPVLFIPLHQFDLTGDLIKAVGEFIRYDQYLKENPIDPDNENLRLLIIFDGLDELVMQDKLGKEVAQEFVREIQAKVSRFNFRRTHLQVLISGREVAVQESFRDPSQILHVLPYFVPEGSREQENGEPYIDVNNLLDQDQRNDWWQKYSTATQRDYSSLPQELNQGNLTEITAQPLLNYLVALSYVQEKLTISDKTNLNTVYADLLDAVYERGYEDNRRHLAIGTLQKEQFIRILEEIALTVLHGNGRTATIKEIESHCASSGLKRLLEIFGEGARTGITRLLNAFYFRQRGVRNNEKTFEFTHKSFGEYLIACRLVRAMDRIQTQLDRRQGDMEQGWDERQALLHWAEVCGPTQLDSNLFNFLSDEVALRSRKEIVKWQHSFCHLIGAMLDIGMPMEEIEPTLKFYEASRWAMNSEEALLVALSACASKTQLLSLINWPDSDIFRGWIGRFQRQLNLNYLDLRGANLRGANLRGANLRGTNLRGANLVEASLISTNLSEANLEGANLYNSNLCMANLENANLENANLCETQVLGTKFTGSVLTGACIQNLQIRSSTIFNQVKCDYIFREYENEIQRFSARFPSDPNSTLLPGEFSRKFQDIINEIDSSAKIEIKISDEFKVAFKQYLVFFEEFVREVKSKKIIFEVLSVSDGLEVLIEASEQEELIEISSYLHEYVSLIGKNSSEIHINFEKNIGHHQAEISLIELRAQLRNLQTSLELKEVKLSYQNEFISYLKQLVNELQHALGLKNQNQPIIISNSTNDSNIVGGVNQGNPRMTIGNQSSGDTYHVGQAGAVGRGARSDNNTFIQSEQKQSLAEAAIEIQNLLKQLERSNPSATLEDKKAFVNAGVSPTIKQKAMNAIKSGGKTALLEFLENSYINIVMAVVDGWCKK